MFSFCKEKRDTDLKSALKWQKNVCFVFLSDTLFDIVCPIEHMFYKQRVSPHAACPYLEFMFI